MGRIQAEEFANAGLPLDTALHWHLQSNHYPPVPLHMVPVCKAAIEAAAGDDWDKPIELPDGVKWRRGGLPSAGEVVTSLHLHEFVEAAKQPKENEE